MKNLFFLFVFLSVQISAQIDIELDSSFASTGIQFLEIGPSMYNTAADQSKCIAKQSDGKILVGGYSNDIGGTEDWIFTVTRFLSDGSLDLSFGQEGIAKVNITNDDDEAYEMAIQEDDKIVLVGRSWVNSRTKMAVARLTANGQPDQDFLNNGRGIFSIGDRSDEGFDVVIQEDGKILLGGRAWFTAEPVNITGWGLLRLLPDGSLDTSFANNGKFYFNSGFYDEGLFQLKLQEDGKILLGGSIAGDAALIRLLESGELDHSFGSQGISNFNEYGSVRDINIDPEERILITVYAQDGICKTIRVMPNGSFDTTFGLFGVNTYDTGQNSFYTSYDEVIVLPNGYILGIGTFNPPGFNNRNASFFLMDENGNTVDSFGEAGVKYIPICTYGIWFINSETLNDNSIIFTGNCSNGTGNSDFLVAKIKHDTIPDKIHPEAPNGTLTICPNPTSGSITITLPDLDAPQKATIYDVLGKKLLDITLEHEETTLNIPQWPAGIYLLSYGSQSYKILLTTN